MLISFQDLLGELIHQVILRQYMCFSAFFSAFVVYFLYIYCGCTYLTYRYDHKFSHVRFVKSMSYLVRGFLLTIRYNLKVTESMIFKRDDIIGKSEQNVHEDA